MADLMDGKATKEMREAEYAKQQYDENAEDREVARQMNEEHHAAQS